MVPLFLGIVFGYFFGCKIGSVLFALQNKNWLPQAALGRHKAKMPTVIALTSQLPRDIEYTVPRRLSEDLYIMTTWNEQKKESFIVMLPKEGVAKFMANRHLYKFTTRKPTVAELAGLNKNW